MANQESIKEKVYNLIMEDILSLEYKPNDILNEKDLVEKYGYSKSPVREALLSLCDERVLRCIPRYGYEVVRITTDDIRDMLQFRYILEGGLLSRCMYKFTPRQIERLEAIHAKCTEADKDVWEHWKYNTHFHLTMLSYCNNSYAVDALSKTMDSLKRAYAQANWNHLDSPSLSMDTRYHADILRSLRDRDLDAFIINFRHDLSNFGGLDYSKELNLENFLD